MLERKKLVWVIKNIPYKSNLVRKVLSNKQRSKKRNIYMKLEEQKSTMGDSTSKTPNITIRGLGSNLLPPNLSLVKDGRG